jgi:hypothetical protein
VKDGLNGYIADTLDELIAKLPEVMALPREPVRRYAEDHFSLEAMADGYESLYYRLVAGRESREITEAGVFNGGELEYASGDLCPSR